MNRLIPQFNGLALTAAVLTAAFGTGCSQKKNADGFAKVGVTITNAETATNISRMTLTVSTDSTSGAPSFSPITSDLTNNDLTKSLSWSTYVTGIPAGSSRLFAIQAFQGTTVIYSGSAHADITAGGTANVYIVLQGPNDGGFNNSLPQVDALSSSANAVVVGTTPPPAPVVLRFLAHDPDSDAMTYAWASTCSGASFTGGTGSVDPVNGNSSSWTAPTSVPPSGVCTLSLTITDSKQGSVTAFLAIQIQATTNGQAVVTAYPNSWPIIGMIAAHEFFTKDSTGKLVGVDIDLIASASDPDGDDITYTWSTPNCPANGFTSGNTPDNADGTAPALPAGSTTLALGPGQFAQSLAHYRTSDTTDKCVIQVNVTDSWKGGIPPAGSGLPVARGGNTVGLINASSPKDFLVGPQITKVDAPSTPKSGTVTPTSATFLVQASQTLQLAVDTFDPTPSFNPAETPFTFTWTQSGGAFVAGAVTTNSASPGRTTNAWTSGNPVAPASFVTVTVTNKDGLQASYTWNFQPSNPCTSAGATTATACDPGLGLCADPTYNGTTNLGGHCDANAGSATSQCVANAPVTCTASDQCHAVGVCNPGSGVCTNPAVTDGTTCSDNNGCTGADSCHAGVCVSGAAVVCNTPTDAQCQSATGTCQSLSATTFQCNYTSVANGTACNADNSGCTQNDSCQSGACTAGPAVVCSQSANPCVAASGTCTSTGANTFNCSYANLPATTSCNTAGACITGQLCNGSGTCAGGTPFCPASQTCNPTGPTCTPSDVVPAVGKDLQLTPPSALATDTSGSTYVGGAIASTTAISFDGIPVASAGDQDIFLAKYDPATHAAVWARSYGDDVAGANNPQIGTGVAVTNDGTLVVAGNFSGKMTFGTSVINNSSQINFLAGVNASNGSRIWASQFNNGANGNFKSIAANPSSPTNRVAVCGLTDIGVAATDFAPGATSAGATDIIIGVFGSNGTRVWANQIGTAADEECDAVTVDDNGDVYAAGKFTGGTLTLGSFTLTGPGSSLRTFLWVAKFNGSTGAVISAAAFGNSSGKVTPTSVATDSAFNVIVGGQFSIALPFGATTLTSAGGVDGFVAKLNPASSYAPVWAGRIGGTGSDSVASVAVDSFGDVVATGLFFKTTTTTGGGLAVLTASGTTAADAFVLKLNGTTGTADAAHAYGDPATQSGDALAINRYGSGAGLNSVTFAGTLNGSATFPAPVGTITATGVTDVFLIFANLH